MVVEVRVYAAKLVPRRLSQEDKFKTSLDHRLRLGVTKPKEKTVPWNLGIGHGAHRVSFVKLFSSYFTWAPGLEIRSPSLRGKCLYPLSHLMGLVFVVVVLVLFVWVFFFNPSFK